MGLNVDEEKKAKPKAKSAKEKRRTGGSSTSSAPSTKPNKKSQSARNVQQETPSPSKKKKSPSSKTSPTKNRTQTAAKVTTTVRPATTKASSGRSKSSKSTTNTSTQGPTSTRINEALLSASSRHQQHRGSMSSLAEPLTPTYGDVRTMVCDVSPVPSDVESIDYVGGTSQLGTGHRGSIISLRRPSNRLRSGGRANEEATGLYGAFARSKQAHTKTSGVPRTPTEAARTNYKGQEVATVQITDHDSNVTKTNSTKKNLKKGNAVVTHGQAKTLTGSPHSDDRKKESKDRNEPKQQLKSKQNAQTPAKVNPSLSNKVVKTQPNRSKKSETNEKKTSKAKKESRKTKQSSDLEILPNDAPNISITVDDVQCEQNNTESVGLATEKCNEEDEGAGEEALENMVENVKADEECRKAFTVLNCKGFKVSLHTLRRALLTPTEYRLLRNDRPPEVKTEHEQRDLPMRSNKKAGK